MENEASAFPAKQRKSVPVRSKYSRRDAEASKADNYEHPSGSGQSRVFGIVRNSNVPDRSIQARPEWKKPSLKPDKTNKEPPTPIRKSVRSKPSRKTAQPEPTTPVEPKPTPKKKKSVSFLVGNDVNPTVDGSTRTPGPIKGKSRLSETPYHTAEKCSKCRFDRMETASYWLAQIKLAEAVGKHFVSAGLFKFAFESKAEPIRSLRGELNQYVSRHRYLSGEPEWIDLIDCYGLNITTNEQVKVLANIENGGDRDQEDDDLINQITQQLELSRKYKV